MIDPLITLQFHIFILTSDTITPSLYLDRALQELPYIIYNFGNRCFIDFL